MGCWLSRYKDKTIKKNTSMETVEMFSDTLSHIESDNESWDEIFEGFTRSN